MTFGRLQSNAIKEFVLVNNKVIFYNLLLPNYFMHCVYIKGGTKVGQHNLHNLTTACLF